MGATNRHGRPRFGPYALLVAALMMMPLVSGVTPPSAAAVPSMAPAPVVSGNQLIDATSGSQLQLRGVDAPGTESACVWNQGFSPDPSTLLEATEIATWHVNAVRVPLNEDCWLGINGVPAKYSGAAYQSFVKSWVGDLNSAGLIAILDLHFAAPGANIPYQQWPMADADHSPTFWSQVAAAFGSNPSVMFDLFNEPDLGGARPANSDWQCWLQGCSASFVPWRATSPVSYKTAGMQQLVSAVRRAGADQPILLGGLNAANDPCGLFDAVGNKGICMWRAYAPRDPANELVASFHLYNTSICTTPTCWTNDVGLVARSNPVVTGEVGEHDCSSAFVDSYLHWADAQRLSYLAWGWTVPTATDTCSSGNVKLLSSWSGLPNLISPVGIDYETHVLSLG